MTKITDEMKAIRNLEKKLARLDKIIERLLAAVAKSKAKKVVKKATKNKSDGL